MTSKTLQPNSKYNSFDADGDGIVSDAELDRSERMLQIENNDKMQDQQRLMAWVAMLSAIAAVAVLLTPYVELARLDTAGAFLNTFLVAQTGIVIGFMGTTAWAKRKDAA
jgi:archaellum biogenesis protein FlaJ (TadC family)